MVFLKFVTKKHVNNKNYASNALRLIQNIRVFPILQWISSIGWIRWIQPESVEHDWRFLKALLSATYSWLIGVMVMTPDWEPVGCEFK